MNSNKIFLIVFVCIAVVCSVEETNESDVSTSSSSESSSSSEQQDKDDPCDTCPLQGKCVPKVSCPAHVRPGSYNPECHLKDGQIGVCCYTGHAHAAKTFKTFKSRFTKGRNDDMKEKAHCASRNKWSDWVKMARKVLEYSEHTVVRSGSPDYGHHLSFVGSDKEAEVLGQGALLNLFAAEELKKQQDIDDDELALGYYEKIEGPYCPPQPICADPPCPYRNINGECNNLEHPTWGAANTGYERLLPPDYSDGIWAFRTSRCPACRGAPLPSPRAISAALLPDGHYPHNKLNMMCMQFGQFMAHDITGAVMQKMGNGSSISCCTKQGGCLPPDQLHWACAPIHVHPDDEFFSHFNKTCLNFVRVQLAPSPDCSCGYAKQMNGVTHFLDLSQLYGKSNDKKNDLQAPGGYMKVFNDYGRELPPLTDRPECITNKEQGACFDSGDNHGNQLITITALHTIFTREHNRIARELIRHNPDCCGDAIFNKTKEIVIALYQHIIYNEWLPQIVGWKQMKTFGLGPSEGYSTCYDPGVNPSLVTEFAGAVLRFGHSTVARKIKTVCPLSGKTLEQVKIEEKMFQPGELRVQSYLDELLCGMMRQPMESVDPIITEGLTRFLFRGGNPFGLDLASMNIQRGRDFGLRPYNDYRELCGLKAFHSFYDYPESARERLSSVYSCADDVDLWIGGLLEKHVEGSNLGHTFTHILLEQLLRLKIGDRFFHDNGPEVNPGAFSPCQLAEIKKVTMARVVCDNCDGEKLTSVSPKAFVRADLPGNEPVRCDDPAIPSMDLSKFTLEC